MATDDFTSNTSTKGNVYLSSSASGISGSATGNIETIGDTDWFRVSLTAGTTYIIDLEGWSKIGTLGALPDTSITGIYDSGGHIISGCATDVGLKSEILFTPTSNQNYYISAGGGLGWNTGTYKLSVVADDFSNNTSTTGRITPGGTATGNIQYTTDSDWFRVNGNLTKGLTYVLKIEGASTHAGTLSNPFVDILDSNANWIQQTHNTGVGSGFDEIYFTAQSTGPYFVWADTLGHVYSGNPDFPSSTLGTYKISLSNGILDDFPDYLSTNTTGIIHNPSPAYTPAGKPVVTPYGSLTANLQYHGDNDVFALTTLSSGTRYRIDVNDVTFSGTTLLRIDDENWHIVAGIGNLLNPSVYYTPTKDNQKFYITVGGDNIHTGSYTVSVTTDNRYGYETKVADSYEGSDKNEYNTNIKERSGFYINNCTSYVAWKINQDHPALNFTNNFFGNDDPKTHNTAKDLNCRFSDAMYWDDIVSAHLNDTTIKHFSIDHNPTIGAIAQWNNKSGMPSGHVAYVESVHYNNVHVADSIHVSEYNYKVIGEYDEQDILLTGTLAPNNFIHVI